MLKKTISDNGLMVSEIGLGCMGMSEFYGPTDEVESLKTLDRALELGVTHFDSADIYDMGHNEELLSRFLKNHREKVVLATKFGIVRDLSNPTVRGINGRPEYVKKCCEASLKRLGIDTIDLYYAHRIDPQTPVEETVGAMAELVKEGKIRFIGLSEATPEQIKRAHSVHHIAAIQSEYSLWTRGPEMEIIPLCKELGIGFVAYSPMGRGFLTGQLKSTDGLAENDYRRHVPRFHDENMAKNVVLIKKLEDLAKTKNCTPAQLSLAWLLYKGEHITAIPGTKRVKYLEENSAATHITVTADEVKLLDEAFPINAAHGARYPAMQMTNADK